MLTSPQQVQSHNGARFQRPRRTDLVPRPRKLQSLHSAMQAIKPEPRAAVELALTMAEEAVVVAQIEAEVEKLAGHRSHIQMDARRMLRSRPRRQSQLHGMHLLLAILGMLPRLAAMIAWILPNLLKWAGASPHLQLRKQLFRRPRASFQSVSRRAGQACLHLLHPRQRRYLSQLLRSMLRRILYMVT